MYRLVHELDEVPGLPPPFIILEDLANLAKWVWRKLGCGKAEEDCERHNFILKSTTLIVSFCVFIIASAVHSQLGEAVKILQLFEKSVMAAFLQAQKEQEEDTMEFKIDQVARK